MSKIDQLEENFARVVAVFQGRAAFLESNYFEARILDAVTRAVLRSESPFVDRAAAAARWFKSESEIDKARRCGLLTDIGGSSPLFEKAQGDALVREGKWIITAEMLKAA